MSAIGARTVMSKRAAHTVAHDEIETNYGKRLAAWIEAQPWRGGSWRQTALAAGMEPSRLTAWRRGAVPGIDQLRLVATTFGRSLSDVLIAIGAMPEGDGPTEPVEIEVVVPFYDIDAAIERDPRLALHERKLLREVRRALATAHDAAYAAGRTFAANDTQAPLATDSESEVELAVDDA